MFLIGLVALLSMSYVLAIEWYDQMPNKITQIFNKITIDEIKYKEIGIKLSGIQYNQELAVEDLQSMNEEMVNRLAHQTDCLNDCEEEHDQLATTIIEDETECTKVQTYNNGERWNYILQLKEQLDTHYNTYYDLEIKGKIVPTELDALRNRGIDQFKVWNVDYEESIYYKGEISGKLSDQERRDLTRRILVELDADETDYYKDDLVDSTCVYYGYTKLFNDYIIENDGDKTNMQVGFKYNDELNLTEVIIAFPFYNNPF